MAKTTEAKETKTTAKKAATAKKAPVAKKTVEEKAVAKKTTTKKAVANAKAEEVFFQFSGYEFSDSELIEKAKADYKATTGKKIIKTIKLYVKPEDMMIYYIVNEKYLGKVAL